MEDDGGRNGDVLLVLLLTPALACTTNGSPFAFGTLIVEGDAVEVTEYPEQGMRSVRLRVAAAFRGDVGAEVQFVLPEVPCVPDRLEAGDHVVISLSPATNTQVPGGSLRFAGVYLRRELASGRAIASTLDGLVHSVSCEGGVGVMPSRVTGLHMTTPEIWAARLAEGGAGAKDWSDLVAAVRSCAASVAPSGEVR